MQHLSNIKLLKISRRTVQLSPFTLPFCEHELRLTFSFDAARPPFATAAPAIAYVLHQVATTPLTKEWRWLPCKAKQSFIIMTRPNDVFLKNYWRQKANPTFSFSLSLSLCIESDRIQKEKVTFAHCPQIYFSVISLSMKLFCFDRKHFLESSSRIVVAILTNASRWVPLLSVHAGAVRRLCRCCRMRDDASLARFLHAD